MSGAPRLLDGVTVPRHHWLMSAQVRRRGRVDPEGRRAAIAGHGLAWHGLRWQCLPAPPLPPQKKGWFWQKKKIVPEPNDRGVVLELLRGEGGGRCAALLMCRSIATAS